MSFLSWCSMFVRTALAMLDHNANCGRDQKIGRDGQPSFTVKVTVLGAWSWIVISCPNPEKTLCCSPGEGSDSQIYVAPGTVTKKPHQGGPSFLPFPYFPMCQNPEKRRTIFWRTISWTCHPQKLPLLNSPNFWTLFLVWVSKFCTVCFFGILAHRIIKEVAKRMGHPLLPRWTGPERRRVPQ